MFGLRLILVGTLNWFKADCVWLNLIARNWHSIYLLHLHCIISMQVFFRILLFRLASIESHTSSLTQSLSPFLSSRHNRIVLIIQPATHQREIKRSINNNYGIYNYCGTVALNASTIIHCSFCLGCSYVSFPTSI